MTAVRPYKVLLTAAATLILPCVAMAEDFAAGDAFLRDYEIASALDQYEGQVPASSIQRSYRSSASTQTTTATTTTTTVTQAASYGVSRETSAVAAPSYSEGSSANAVTLDSLNLPSQEQPLDYSKVKAPDNDPNHSTNTYFNRVVVHGEMKASFGINSDSSVTFLRANGNLTERNFSLLTRDQLFNGKDTYDPALYPSLKLWMDAPINDQVSTHLSLAFDPWSYVGKSKEFIVNGVGGDSAKIQYISWGATGYTLGQSFYTRQNGDAFSISEQKINNGNIVPANRVQSSYTNIFNIPDAKLEYSFQPIREAWVDIKPEPNTKLRIFPMGLQDQAQTSDDPFRLSNNMIWWEESPWIASWKPGQINRPTGSPENAFKGNWDRSLSFFTRDSDLQRLTALRGVSLKSYPDEDNLFEATIATPKTLWQEYRVVNAIPASVRAKHYFEEQAYLGTVANAHQGYNNGRKDAENYTGGIDGGYVPADWLLVNAEYAVSNSRYDQKLADYQTKKNGKAYYLSFATTTAPMDALIRKDYFALAPAQENDAFLKTRFYFSRMDDQFESTLANYRETAQDSFWSRHLTYYPNTYRYMPGVYPSMSEDNIAPFAIGNGIGYGRNVYAWRGDTQLAEGRVKGLADFRRVMSNNHKQHIETVARTQWMLQATDKLTTKALFLWHALPKTKQGIDPFLTSNLNDGAPLLNVAIPEGEDPSSKVLTLGAQYELTKWAKLNGVWEYTNDSALGSNYFPQGIMTDAFLGTYDVGTTKYSKYFPFMYNQGVFDQPPYDMYHVFKTGLELIPTDPWHIYLDYTFNPRHFAGNIDDSVNHWGAETSYVPNKFVGFFARYTYTRWVDIQSLNQGPSVLKYRGYNNLYFETRLLMPAETMISLKYGVGPTYNLQTAATNPNLSYYTNPVLSTQHIIRLTCEKKF